MIAKTILCKRSKRVKRSERENGDLFSSKGNQCNDILLITEVHLQLICFLKSSGTLGSNKPDQKPINDATFTLHRMLRSLLPGASGGQ